MRVHSRLPIVILVAGWTTSGGAQAPKLAFAAPAPNVMVTRNVPYASDGTTALAMDVYQLPRARDRVRPALVFWNRGSGSDRAQPLYDGWGRAAASHDLVGIVPDLREGSEGRDFRALVAYLMQHGTRLGIDTGAIAVYAASGNVSTALPVLEAPDGSSIKAAVIYYGTAPITAFRRDLPLLWVRAGLDRPDVNEDINRVAGVAIAQNAPVTLLNHPTGYHAFELFNDDEATRAVIDETMEFVRRATARAYRVALLARQQEALAAGAVQTGDFRAATGYYAGLVRDRPNDARLVLSYGEALLGDGQYQRACALFATLKERGLGKRDLGVPAARACAQAGDGEAAVAWLKSIPSRFLPAALADDSAFASIRQRADFRALFSSSAP